MASNTQHEDNSLSMPSSSLRASTSPTHSTLRWLGGFFRSDELDNVGSTARDHLALERTFLAFVRTSLSLLSFGIAVAQFFRLPATSTGNGYCGGGGRGRGGDGQRNGRKPEVESRAGVELLGLRSTTSLSFLTGGDDVTTIANGGSARAVAKDLDWPREELQRLVKPIGCAYIALAILVLVFGASRYFAVQADLMRTRYTPSTVEGESRRSHPARDFPASAPLPSPPRRVERSPYARSRLRSDPTMLCDPVSMMTLLVGALTVTVLAVIVASPTVSPR